LAAAQRQVHQLKDVVRRELFDVLPPLCGGPVQSFRIQLDNVPVNPF
jgi:hypothetical protein